MSSSLARRAAFPFEPGDAAPPLNGVGGDNAFFSLEAQAGRAAVLLFAPDGAAGRVDPWLAALAERLKAFAKVECDLRLISDLQNRQAGPFACDPFAAPLALFVETEAFRRFGGEAPFLVLIDRATRIVGHFVDEPAAAAEAALAAASALPLEKPHDDAMPAPVLVIPNVLSTEICQALIAHFEASPYERGGMAGRDAQGRGYHKIDETKKNRFDLVLAPTDRLLAPSLNGIIRRVIPEIRKAFHVNIAHTDRLLLARYDEGGFFRRHRDNAAPGVEFRQFALSINLNDDYEGGQVIFPEYNSRRYRPGTGAGVVFSCSLLHEATPVSKGRRYALLTFLHDSAAQARWMASTRAA